MQNYTIDIGLQLIRSSNKMRWHNQIRTDNKFFSLFKQQHSRKEEVIDNNKKL